MEHRYKVVIVGGGPVGVALAVDPGLTMPLTGAALAIAALTPFGRRAVQAS